MSDMGDLYLAWAEHKKDRKLTNLKKNMEILIESKIPFSSKNNGYHLIVSFDGGIVDFWPSTNIWSIRSGSANKKLIRKTMLNLFRGA